MSRRHREQASRQLARLVNCFVHQLHNLGGVGGVGNCFSASFASCTLAMKAMPVRCWPRPSCKILSDAPLLAGADVQQAFSNCSRSVMSMPVAMK